MFGFGNSLLSILNLAFGNFRQFGVNPLIQSHHFLTQYSFHVSKHMASKAK